MVEFAANEMNYVFEFIVEYVDFWKKNKYIEITLESISYDEDIEELLKPLVGYQVKVKIDGDHRNDGQMVDYGFYFKNQDGKVTEVWTEMCLMCGWNHCEDEKII